MAKINNHQRVLQHWDWTEHGYEKGFPRGCQFSDIDAIVEFDGRALVIESKFYDGSEGEAPSLKLGQRMLLSKFLRLGFEVVILWGEPEANNPLMLMDWRTRELHDWRGLSLSERRKSLKRVIDSMMRVAP